MNQFKSSAFAVALGTLAATALAPQAMANPFAMQELASGYQVDAPEAKCGGDMKAEPEAKCGAEMKAEGEGKCGEAKCGADKKEKAEAEGKCGADKKAAEAKCGGTAS